jgi:purine-binding chemotaxis protein CheW
MISMAAPHDIARQSATNKPDADLNGPAAMASTGIDQERLQAVWAQRARVLAEPLAAPTAGKTSQLLAFLLAGQRYAVEVSFVREIYPAGQITMVPRAPDFIVGLFSARGRLITVIDLHAFLGLPQADRHNECKLIVVTAPEIEVALIADQVSDVTTIFEDQLEPASSAHMPNLEEYIQGIGPGGLAVLNLPALLNSKRLVVYEEVL